MNSSNTSEYKCARRGCDRPAVVLVKETADGVSGFPLCAECEEWRQTELALRGNAYTRINRDRIVFAPPTCP